MSRYGNYNPNFPLDRITNETMQVSVCKICGSSMVRKYWIYFFGKTKCINKKCPNAKIS